MKNYFFLCLSVAGLVSSCNVNKSISGFLSEDVDCLGVEMDGTQTLIAVGLGKNRYDAIEQAKKNAVSYVLFNGSRGASRGCYEKPMILELNSRNKHEAYFNNFFRDGGDYLNFIDMDDEKRKLRINRRRVKGRLQVKVSTTVRVNYYKLQQQLKKDSII
jgi:hypothetical protein